jgi:hypothetical protein
MLHQRRGVRSPTSTCIYLQISNTPAKYFTGNTYTKHGCTRVSLQVHTSNSRPNGRRASLKMKRRYVSFNASSNRYLI